MRSRADITDNDVREIMAAGEDITRRFIGEVLDVVADSATERAARWCESQEAIRNLRRIREAINNGEELTYAVIDFWISVLPDPDMHLLRVEVTDDEQDILTELGLALGTTAQGYVTMLAQKAVLDATSPLPQPVPIRRQAVIVAMTREQGEMFLMNNATSFAGWSVVIHNRMRSGPEKMRGMRVDLAVILNGEPLDDMTRDEIMVITRGDQPAVVEANEHHPFDPDNLYTQEPA